MARGLVRTGQSSSSLTRTCGSGGNGDVPRASVRFRPSALPRPIRHHRMPVGASSAGNRPDSPPPATSAVRPFHRRQRRFHQSGLKFRGRKAVFSRRRQFNVTLARWATPTPIPTTTNDDTPEGRPRGTQGQGRQAPPILAWRLKIALTSLATGETRGNCYTMKRFRIRGASAAPGRVRRAGCDGTSGRDSPHAPCR